MSPHEKRQDLRLVAATKALTHCQDVLRFVRETEAPVAPPKGTLVPEPTTHPLDPALALGYQLAALDAMVATAVVSVCARDWTSVCRALAVMRGLAWEFHRHDARTRSARWLTLRELHEGVCTTAIHALHPGADDLALAEVTRLVEDTAWHASLYKAERRARTGGGG